MPKSSPSISYELGFNNEWIFAKASKDILESLLRIPQAIDCWDTHHPHEHFTAFPASREAFMIAEALSIPAIVSEEYKKARDRYVGLSLKQLATIDNAVCSWQKDLTKGLKIHQLEFLAQLWTTPKMMNASEQGTGKTLPILYIIPALNTGGIKRTLIVCAKDLAKQWERQWSEAWNGNKPFGMCLLTKGTKTDRREKLIGLGNTPAAWPIAAIINYEVIHDLRDAIQTYDPQVLIVDESFRASNHEAKVTKTLWEIADRCICVVPMTGTPMGNRGAGDLYAQLRLLGLDVVPEDYWQFVFKYANAVQINVGTKTVWKVSGCSDPVGFWTRFSPYWFRALKSTCLDLPPKQYEVVKLEFPKKTRTLYDDVEKDGECVLGNPLSLSSNRVVKIRLHQICGGFRPVYDPYASEDLTDKDVDNYRHITASRYRMEPIECPKIEWIIQWAKNVLVDHPSTRAIIWCRYIQEIIRVATVVNELLYRRYDSIQVCIAKGGIRDDVLDAAKVSFNSRDPRGIQVIVAQTEKMAEGHDLPACDWSIRFSSSWSCVKYTQAEDRGHRIGRENPINYVDLLMEDSVDEEVYSSLQSNRDFNARLCVET